MKYDPHKSFGYPVLRPPLHLASPESRDYLEVAFQASIDMLLSKDRLEEFEIDYQFNNSLDALKQKIKEGKASYFIRVECPATYYASTNEVSDSGSFFIQGDLLRDQVIVSSFVLAKEAADISSPKINPEFGLDTFSVIAGNVLAITPPKVYYVEKDMFRPIVSLFDFREQDVPMGEFRVNLEEDYVKIDVNTRQKKIFQRAIDRKDHGGEHARSSFIASVAMTAVVRMVQELQTEDGKAEHANKKWAKVLAARYPDYENSSPIEVAQKILRQPIKTLNENCFSQRGA